MCDYSKMQELSQNSSRAEVKVDSSGRGSSGSMPKKYFGSWDLGLGRIVWSILGAQEIQLVRDPNSYSYFPCVELAVVDRLSLENFLNLITHKEC